MIEISKNEEIKIVQLYVKQKYTLRRIAKIYHTDHHRIGRILEKYQIEINNDDRTITSRKGYKKKPFTEEHRKILDYPQKEEKQILGKRCQK